MSTILDLINRHEFTKLFVEELGWDRPDTQKSWTPSTAGEDFTLTQVASFSGLRVWHCPQLPSRSVQRGIDNELSKTNAERLVIFSDGTHQEWRWPRHRQLSGVNAKLMVHPHTVGEPDHNLESRLKAIELSIDDDVTLTQLLSRMRVAFDVESETASQQAARLMGTLYEHLNTAGMESTQATLLLSRLLFLFFGDDTGMWRPNAFRDWMAEHVPVDKVSIKIEELFEVLDDPQADNGTANAKPWTLNEQYKGFRYVNGGLFAEKLSVPLLDATFRDEILEACKFDWSVISPAVFGSMFQTVKDSKARRELGEHYTTETNIQRLIGPLFLDELEERLDRAWESKTELTKLHNHLGELRFMDPACGCGNFLVVTYRELRALELRLLKRREELDAHDGRSSGPSRAQSAIHVENATEVKVSLDHFYGIEIEDWPARIAQTAMLLVDHQANQSMAEQFGTTPAKLPIKVSATIKRANALEIDWNNIVPASSNVVIMGNPPFIGERWREQERTDELKSVWGSEMNAQFDYVTAWYKRTVDYMGVFSGRWGFVSTNSIVQGEPVASLFEPIYRQGWHIKFAHRTFRWETEAPGAAGVHCVIIGFTRQQSKNRRLFNYDHPRAAPQEEQASNINAYLINGPDILVRKRTKMISSSLSPLVKGSYPTDGRGSLSIWPDEISMFRNDPVASKYIRKFVGSRELLHNEDRWCLWLKDLTPGDLERSELLRQRVEAVRSARLKSSKLATRNKAESPHLFDEGRQPSKRYLAVPVHSSETRLFLPAAYYEPDVICYAANFLAEDPDGYLFGMISSSMFMTWLKTVGGRLESRLRVSNTIVWNNFPLPSVGPLTRQQVIDGGQAILVERERYPDRSLSAQYSPATMDAGLTEAHQKLDMIVDHAFGAEKPCESEKDRQEILFTRYAEMISGSQ